MALGVETQPLSCRFEYSRRLIHHNYRMGIFRALGSGIFLVTIALLMPTVFTELSKTLVVFLQSSQEAFASAGILASYAGHIPPSVH